MIARKYHVDSYSVNQNSVVWTVFYLHCDSYRDDVGVPSCVSIIDQSNLDRVI